MLMLYNTISGRKERFEPLVTGTVRMYVCGVTAYDECHLGHARSAIVFDVIRRYLQYRGFAVTYVRNFTDVDDKIIDRAKRDDCEWNDVSEEYIRAYSRDMRRLSVAAPDIEPRATEHIADMLEIIEALVARGFAYQVDGDVYFRVDRFPGYGCLSHRTLEDMLAGARVDVDERKRHPMDFALWKASKPDEPAWESPWGPGRPGWHIECSAMALRLLGKTFDIHGGGEDLIFPHHENEIAQSCAFTGVEFARYWIHNGFVTIRAEKMSKSLSNTFTVRALFESSAYREPVTAEVLRYFLLTANYRSPIDLSDDSLLESKRALNHFYDLFLRIEEVRSMSDGRGDTALDQQAAQVLNRLQTAFDAAMDDDVNTASAIGELQRARTEINGLLTRGVSQKAATSAIRLFQTLGNVLGVFQLPPNDWEFGEKAMWMKAGKSSIIMDETAVMKLVKEREAARTNKDWKRSDQIRDLLGAHGVILEDRPDGTTRWKR